MANMKILSGVMIFALFVATLFYLSSQDTADSQQASATRFTPYAEALELDLTQFAQDFQDKVTREAVFADVALGNEKQISSTPTFFVNGEKVNRLDETVIANHRARGAAQTAPEGKLLRGAQSPTVIIEEFSDFECPACAAQAIKVKGLLEQFPDDVALVYRHYPLVSIHDYAEAAARAAEAAGKQGKFWEMHDLLFEKQSEWSQ